MMYPSDINVLIACEESQVEMQAFRLRGFNAFACDLVKPKRGADLRYQIQSDVTPLLQGLSRFQTLDGHHWRLPQWDLIICHPPCTYLCKSGSVQLYDNGKVKPERLTQMKLAREFFQKCLDASAPYVAVENPLPMARAGLPKPTTYVEPFWFGSEYTKKTLLWLKNLPPLMPTIITAETKSLFKSTRGKYRSRTQKGIAMAMADQWGDFVLHEMNCRC